MIPDSVQLGRFRFHVSYRHLRGDEGLCIRVLGPVDGNEEELLRYDCFKQEPHFHTEVFGKNTITPITSDHPVGWTLEQLRTSLAELVVQSGGDQLDGEETSRIVDAVDQLAIAAKGAYKASRE
ncbi:MAG: hypothetical protein J4F97_02505 [Pseudomonadales bacterium]|nr:hypothetical protein [Pseudomonadales bacterium]